MIFSTAVLTMHDPGGELIDGDHHLPVRVYYEDTDAGGIVYHANYLNFAERGRTEMLRAMGIDQQVMRVDSGLIFAVHAAAIRYKSPARLDDLLCIRSRVTRISGASATIDQTVLREEQVLAEIEVKVACIDSAGRPRRLPQKVRQGLHQTFKADQVS